MNDQIEQFLKFLEEEKKYADNTIAAYQNDLNQFMQFVTVQNEDIQAENWTEVGKSAISAYIAHLKNSGYSSSTVARKVAAIKSFFHFLVAEHIISEDPTFTLDSPKVKKRLPKAISPGEIEKILKAPIQENGPKAQRDLALLEMLYASGMRVTELVSLDTTDLDFSTDSTGKVRVRGKRANKEREIPLTGHTITVLNNYIHGGREQLAHDPNENALFLNNRGQRLTRQGLWLIIKHYVEAVGISSEVTPHTLRHSFAAHKLSQGKSLQDIQKLLGHANISTTQVYAHITQENEKK
ncbi:MAG TPA: tyrosine recombinase [Anaerolineae bacterium]|nr:tyrosine recombinase [Anaerolineae bacterium]MCB0179514.1 tyrosine recombinase [Anaerolineae bacterium]MCB0224960.1 tyrosine recombinase [Anaerolineae bacterium]MCB9107585.1 tyrosine recombinase [Anaerolineales bacterium]HRV91320.1 tyrosine recombinase [Anaerolineae bacterium]